MIIVRLTPEAKEEMMRFLILLFLIFSLPATSQEIYSNLCLKGCPLGSPQTNDLIIREIYILNSNDNTKFADWVAYKITPESIGSTKTRTWKVDPLLADKETLEPQDYNGANAALKTDRGHQAPLASFTSTEYWKDTNYLSNITPQKSSLNQGSWLRLESEVRSLVRSENDQVYVMTGPLFERNIGTLPGADEAHIIPSAYWKIVAVEDNDVVNVTGFIFEQELTRSANHCDQIKSIQEIQSRSNLIFFHAPNTTVNEFILGLCN